jgi:hypothetical protein
VLNREIILKEGYLKGRMLKNKSIEKGEKKSEQF